LSDELVDEVDRFSSEFRRKLNRKHAYRSEVFDTIVELYRYIRVEIKNGTPGSVLFRGTLLRFLSLCYHSASIIVDEDEAVAKAMYDFSLISEFLEESRNEVLRAMSNALPG
jgi:hypothetical protein